MFKVKVPVFSRTEQRQTLIVVCSECSIFLN